MGLLKKIHRSDSAQVLPMFMMLLVLLVGMIGLATDISRVYVARAELGRSVDAAALAGATKLPDTALADSTARAYIAANEPGATINVQVAANISAQQVGVTATKTVKTIFMRLLGIDSVDVSNEAVAGSGVSVPVDAVLAIDNTGSMGDAPCNGSQNNSGCPIHEAKNAAIGFTNTLLPGTNTVVGVTGFRGCFKPGRHGQHLRPDKQHRQPRLERLQHHLEDRADERERRERHERLRRPRHGEHDTDHEPQRHTASNTIREIIILSDGDNNYNSIAYVFGVAGFARRGVPAEHGRVPGLAVVECDPRTPMPTRPAAQRSLANASWTT